MEKIKINETTSIGIYFETQISKLGRPYRLSGIRKNLQLPSKWIDKTEKYHWIYSFIYLDDQGGIFEIEIDYNNKFVKLTK